MALTDWLRPWPAPTSVTTTTTTDLPQEQNPRRVEPLAPRPQPESLPVSPSTTTVNRDSSDEENEEYFYRHGPSLAIPMTSASLGFVAGFYTHAKRSGLIFMAENAHRRPNTVQGWYFYNKTKNYKVLLAGARGGLRTALRMGAWTAAYVVVEQAVQRVRETRIDERFAWNGRWIDGATAGTTVATGASFLYRLSSPIARRVIGLGLLTGASIGGLRQAQGRLADVQIQQAHSSSTTTTTK